MHICYNRAFNNVEMKNIIFWDFCLKFRGLTGLASVWRVIKLQLILGIICTVIVLICTRNGNDVFSSILGCLIALIPTFLYIKVVFRSGVVNYPRDALKLHKKAMIVRFLTSFGLFILVICLFKECNFLVLFLTYIMSLSAYWFSLV